MAMSLARRMKCLPLDGLFFGLTALGWLLVQGPGRYPENMSLGQLLAYSFGSALLAVMLLHLVNRPSPLRVVPRKSDMFLVWVATLGAAVLVKLVLEGVYGEPFGDLRLIVASSMVLAAGAFSFIYLATVVMLHSGVTKKIVIDLLPGEKARLLAELSAQGVERYFQFLSHVELKEHLLRGRADEIELIVISKGAVQQFDADAMLLRAHLTGIPIVDFHKVLAELTGRIAVEEADLWSFVHYATRQTLMLRIFSKMKQFIEPIMALFLGIALSPLIVMVGTLVKLTSRGPVFYKQVRLGYLGQSFMLYKFRSMDVDAEAAGPQLSTQNDIRVTKLGRYLRRSRLDELPQLWNVIKGDMSFFGPRPERPEMYRTLRQDIPLFSMRTIVRPGITGWAQVCSGYAASLEECREKLEYDLYYIQNLSPRLDLIVFLKTVGVALFGTREYKQTQVSASQALEISST